MIVSQTCRREDSPSILRSLPKHSTLESPQQMRRQRIVFASHPLLAACSHLEAPLLFVHRSLTRSSPPPPPASISGRSCLLLQEQDTPRSGPACWRWHRGRPALSAQPQCSLPAVCGEVTRKRYRHPVTGPLTVNFTQPSSEPRPQTPAGTLLRQSECF